MSEPERLTVEDVEVLKASGWITVSAEPPERQAQRDTPASPPQQPVPADQPDTGAQGTDAVQDRAGLTAALKAGVEAALAVYADHGLDEDEQTDVELAAGDAVRAAAPRIQREARRELAIELATASVDEFGTNGAIVADWLLARAGRVMGDDSGVVAREVIGEEQTDANLAPVVEALAWTKKYERLRLLLTAEPAFDDLQAAVERGRQQVIAQVLALHSPAEGWEHHWNDPAMALANGWPMCAGCALPGIGQRDLAHCPTRALLTATATEGIPT